MADAAIPVTERSNALCADLDGGLGPEAFLARLAAADCQILSGFESYMPLKESIAALVDASAAARAVADRAGGAVVMTGCGTSGRLAFLTARRHRDQKAVALRYAMAGGDSALLLSDELPEDDPEAGRADARKAAGCAPSVSYVVGVTCGLSAPYVAGQLAAWAPNAAVVGFNPLHLARDRSIPKVYPPEATASTDEAESGASFRQVLMQAQLDDARHITLINPVIGPEPVGGSSRMKGGTTTLVLLEAFAQLLTQTDQVHDDPKARALAVLDRFASAMHMTHTALASSFAPIMAAAATALHSGGHLYYVGAGSAGCVGFIDLSEMPDTYGSPFDQSRAFVVGGWRAVGNVEGDLSHRSGLHRICAETDFLSPQGFAASLTSKDCVVILVGDDASEDDRAVLREALAVAAAAGSAVAVISAPTDDFVLTRVAGGTTTTGVPNKMVALLPPLEGPYLDLSFKLALNAVSTYAQAAGRGALFKGVMIAAGPANDKIYCRCVRLIAETVRVSEQDAEIALLRSIYTSDDLVAMRAKLDVPREAHIRAALLPEAERHQAQLTLPVAFLLAIPSTPNTAAATAWTVQRARAVMMTEPRLYTTLSRALLAASTDNRNLVTALPPAAAAGANQPQPQVAALLVLGVDFGGTHVRAALVSIANAADGGDRVEMSSDVAKRAWGDSRSMDAVARTLLAAIDEAMSAWQCTTPIAAVAVSQPGHADSAGAVGLMAAFPDWGESRLPLRTLLRDHFAARYATPGLDVFINDDGACAVHAEAMAGAGRLAGVVAGITVGTGVGGGLVISRGGNVKCLHRGARGLVEIGHHIVYSSESCAERCGCGQYGCIETVASGTAIAAAAGTNDAEAAFAKADAGDAQAMASLNRAANALGVLCINVTRFYDPDVVVVCGPVASRLLPQVRAAIRSRTWSLHPDAAMVPVSCASCEEPGVIGAATTWFAQSSQHQSSNQLSSPPSFVLRHATAADLDGLLNVCLKTGDSGNDGTALFSDVKLLGSIFVAPYVLHSAAFAFALAGPCPRAAGVSADVVDGLYGYTLGVLDSRAFYKECMLHYWPRLLRQYRDRYHELRANEQSLVDEYIAKDWTALSNEDEELLSEFPSHMHIDIVAAAQGRGFGPIMVSRLLDALKGAGSPGVHLVMSATNARAYKFYGKLGFRLYRETNGGLDWILVRKL